VWQMLHRWRNKALPADASAANAGIVAEKAAAHKPRTNNRLIAGTFGNAERFEI
jgi:hypothetical protein